MAAPWVADNGDGTYRNPILYADWSDPDAIRVGDDFYMIASSFHRVPGLPVLHSHDLVTWSLIGHALERLEPVDEFRTPQWGCGVWAPALRHHDGLFWIVYPDPDRGIFVVTATDPAGPWSPPRLLKGGRGLIDPCPLWDDDGSAYLVHGWAKSRAGFNNKLTAHRMSPDATELLDAGRDIVDGDALPGYRTLEGPKWYKRDGWYWIFAPAGGVATGWQSAFRSREVFGPYEDRIVLAQGDTEVNGPHQGAWVTTAKGEDWFLHFQDRGPFGRIVHLQPVRWGADGWPEIGAAGEPVTQHVKPAVADPRPAPPNESLQWTWSANPEPGWAVPLPGGGFRLACVPSGDDLRALPNVLGRRLPADRFRATVTLCLTGASAGVRAGLTVLGATYAWIGLVRTDGGDRLVYRVAGEGESEADAVPATTVDTPVVLGVDVHADGTCQFRAGDQPVGPPFPATGGRWVGATLGIFATGDGGTADFTDPRITA